MSFVNHFFIKIYFKELMLESFCLSTFWTHGSPVRYLLIVLKTFYCCFSDTFGCFRDFWVFGRHLLLIFNLDIDLFTLRRDIFSSIKHFANKTNIRVLPLNIFRHTKNVVKNTENYRTFPGVVLLKYNKSKSKTIINSLLE